MFENPSEGFQAVDPGRYIVKVVGLDPTEHVEYGPGIKWRFNVADQASGTPVYQADGSMYELWQTTSTKLSPRSRARPWVEALLGRDLADGDTGPALAQEVVGKKALALVGPNDKGYTSILSMSPYKAPQSSMGHKSGQQAAPTAPRAQQSAEGTNNPDEIMTDDQGRSIRTLLKSTGIPEKTVADQIGTADLSGLTQEAAAEAIGYLSTQPAMSAGAASLLTEAERAVAF